MLLNIIKLILKTYVYFVLAALLVSLSSASAFTISVMQTLAGPMLLLYFVYKWLASFERQPRFLFIFFFTLILWLGIQQIALVSRWPFFDTPTLWVNWLPTFSLILTGMTMYLITQDILGEREQMLRFVHFWIFLSAAAGAFFIYIFYTSKVQVEMISLPRFLGPFSPAGFQPNNLIDLLMPGLFFALSIILYNQRRRLSHSDPSRAVSEMLLFLCFACVILASMVFTNSRAGIVALALAIGSYCVLLIFTNRKRRGLLKFLGIFFVIAGLFLCSLGLKEVIEELLTIQAGLENEIQTLGTRTMVIGASWHLILAKGGLGVGLGNFSMGWLLNHEVPFTYFPQISFNDFLWSWAEMGLPGILCLAGLFLTFLIVGFRTAYVSKSCFVSFFMVSCMASLLGFVAHSFVDITFYAPSLFLITCLYLGVGGACRQIEDVETLSGIVVPGTTKKIPWWGAVLLIAVILPVSYLSFNQLRAYLLARKQPPTAENIKKAVELDFQQPYYPLFLSSYYRNDFLESGDEKMFQRALQAVRESIHRDPFQVNAYISRAELYLHKGDLRGIEESFQKMEERVPDFYFAQLAACAFYMNASLERSKPGESDRFQALALRYYSKALEQHPSLNRGRDLYGWLSPEARKRFDELLSKQISP